MINLVLISLVFFLYSAKIGCLAENRSNRNIAFFIRVAHKHFAYQRWNTYEISTTIIIIPDFRVPSHEARFWFNEQSRDIEIYEENWKSLGSSSDYLIILHFFAWNEFLHRWNFSNIAARKYFLLELNSVAINKK